MSTGFLRTLRELHGWGVREVATRSGLSAATISRTERFPESLRVVALISILRGYGIDGLADELEAIVGKSGRKR